MNILHLTSHLNAGGITSYLLTLSEGMISRGHQVFIAAQGGDMVPAFERLGVQVIITPWRVKSEFHPRLWWYFPGLIQHVNRLGIDVIHAHTRTTQVLGQHLSQWTRRPMVTTCHGFFKPRWHRRMWPCWGKAVIAISLPVSQHLQKDFAVNEDQIVTISNGINIQRFRMVNEDIKASLRERWGIDNQIKVIGLIARFSSVKGIDVLIDAFHIFHESVPDVLLLIIGEGPEETFLKKKVLDLGLSKSVRFHHAIGDSAAMLPLFDIVVAPSRMEGLGLSAMEAMACSLPVVASRVGGLAQLIDSGLDGFLVQPENPKELAIVLKGLLSFQQGAEAMGRQARKKIVTHYTSDQMVDKTIGLYERYLSH